MSCRMFSHILKSSLIHVLRRLQNVQTSDGKADFLEISVCENATCNNCHGECFKSQTTMAQFLINSYALLLILAIEFQSKVGTRLFAHQRDVVLREDAVPDEESG